MLRGAQAGGGVGNVDDAYAVDVAVVNKVVAGFDVHTIKTIRVIAISTASMRSTARQNALGVIGSRRSWRLEGLCGCR